MLTETPKSPVPGIAIVVALLMSGMFVFYPINFLINGETESVNVIVTYFLLSIAAWLSAGFQKGMANKSASKKMAQKTFHMISALVIVLCLIMIAAVIFFGLTVLTATCMIVGAPAAFVAATLAGSYLERYSKHPGTETNPS